MAAHPSRPPDRPDVSVDEIREALDLYVGLVHDRLPERLWPGQQRGPRLPLTALVVRAAGIARSVGVLCHPDNEADCATLVRSLYEHVVTFAWVAADPRPRMQRWMDYTHAQRLALHNDAVATIGVAVLDTEEEIASANAGRERHKASGRLNVAMMALEADRYWVGRIAGLYGPNPGQQSNVLSLRGLYATIYRTASRHVHATIEGADVCVSQDGRRVLVHPQHVPLFMSALAVPLLAIALLISNRVLGWPDDHAVRRINDEFNDGDRGAAAFVERYGTSEPSGTT